MYILHVCEQVGHIHNSQINLKSIYLSSYSISKLFDFFSITIWECFHFEKLSCMQIKLYKYTVYANTSFINYGFIMIFRMNKKFLNIAFEIEIYLETIIEWKRF